MLLAGVILASAAATWAALKYSRWQGLIDQPGVRRSHDRPIARAGGLGPVLVLVSFWIGMSVAPATVYSEPYHQVVMLITAATALLAALGFWDDHRSLPALLRLLVQAAVLTALGIGLAVILTDNPVSGLFAALLILTILLMMGMLNAFNFMDGSHGMALGQGLFVSLVLGYLLTGHGDTMAWQALLLAACLLGFFPFNFPRPVVFLGDVGSMGIGTALLGLLLYAWLTGTLSWWELILIMQVFLVDTGLTLLDRIRRRQQWYTSHRDHAYQRLIRCGWKHAQVMGLYLLVNLIVTLPGLWLTQTDRLKDVLVLAASLTILSGGWIMVHIKTKHVFRSD